MGGWNTSVVIFSLTEMVNKVEYIIMLLAYNIYNKVSP